MKKIALLIISCFLSFGIFAQIKEINCSEGTTTLEKIADTANYDFNYLQGEIDTLPKNYELDTVKSNLREEIANVPVFDSANIYIVIGQKQDSIDKLEVHIDTLPIRYEIDTAKANIRQEIADAPVFDSSNVYIILGQYQDSINFLQDSLSLLKLQNDSLLAVVGDTVSLSEITPLLADSNSYAPNGYISRYYLENNYSSSGDTTYREAQTDSLKARIVVLEDSLSTFNWLRAQIGALWDSLGATAPVFDETAPLFVSAELGTYNDSIVLVKLDTNDIHQDSIPLIAAFDLTQNGTSVGLDTVYIQNDSLLIVLDSTLSPGTTLLLDYTQGYPALQDSSGNKVVNWVNKTVTNNITAPVAYFDNFNSYSNDADLNGHGGWVKMMGVIHSYDHSGQMKARSYRDLLYSIYYKDSTISDDHFVQSIISNASGTGGTYPAARISADSSCYFYKCGGGGRVFGKMINGTPTNIATYGTSTTSGTLRIEAEGSTIRCYLNGELDTQLTGGTGIFIDTDLPTGDVGIFGYENQYSYCDDWTAGDL